MRNDVNKWESFFCEEWKTLLLFCLFVLVLACATVPLTGRKSLNLIPEPELLALSFQQYSQVLKESRIVREGKKVHLVRNAGRRIATATEEFLVESGRGDTLKNYQWEFNVINDDKTVNAWCMPGGKVAVYTGIFPVARGETGLAVVLGHEIAHAIAGHGNERMSDALLVQLGGMALSVALQKQPAKTRQIFMTAYGAGATLSFLLPYSRLHESEADRIGLVLMARAGYNPEEAIALWERMNEEGGPRPPEFLSTHPAPESRIEDIKSYLPEAMSYYHGSRQSSSDKKHLRN